MDAVFKALNDPGRRALLDRLFKTDGLTLGELCEVLPDMTRFGVMNHLGVLEDAELITTRRDGRRKLHYLNPVPIRLVHDRWISKYTESLVGSVAALKTHLEGGRPTRSNESRRVSLFGAAGGESARRSSGMPARMKLSTG